MKAIPYDGIFQLLSDLTNKGIVCAVATYKREDYALALLKHYGFDKYMDIMYGADNENKLSKKNIIMKCIDRSKIMDRNSIVMIGDTSHDLKGASELNIDFIGVTYGFGFKSNEKHKYDFMGIADTPMQVSNLIL